MDPVSQNEIHQARERISEIHQTPLFTSQTMDSQCGAEVFFKAENLQKSGSFKIRGALNAVRSLPFREKECGVITYSSGNHGQATALASSMEGVACTVVVPEDIRETKKQAIISYGANIEKAGYTTEERYQKAQELSREHGYTIVPPYDDPRIVAGQGSVGLELIEQTKSPDAVLVPVGGGGLISGIALAVKYQSPQTQVIGVETEGADDAVQSFYSGRLVRLDTVDTIADGIRSLQLGDINFEIIRRHVDDIITVSDEQVKDMTHFFFERMKLVVEPTGAVASAALNAYPERFENKKMCSVISGGNAGVKDFATLLLA